MTPVERMARAMAATSANQSRTPDEKWPLDKPIFPPMLPYWRELARAALAALREPTAAMVEAGKDPVFGDVPDAALAPDCWRAMIDAALKEEPTP